ncbi:hypothetical protein DSO57_1025250 [Entomophthora muscae]|uniref:Uncharacterized protein n=1 Tax=Entomophthora muscae TaxID=34485 RepID=A0ACC2T2A6_9FUNG|nr:hypothetical protein DSO57_1025250 [Entomophthora muscae]
MSLLKHFFSKTKYRISQGAHIAWNLDEYLNWRQEMPLIKFSHDRVQTETGTYGCLDDWLVGSDSDIGGKSTASLELTPEGTGMFHGNISQHLLDHLEVKVHGYAAIKSKFLNKTFLSEELWDTSDFRYLALRLRGSDGKNGAPPPRRFSVNIKTDGFVPTDLFQHRLFLNRPGSWETVLIPFQDFVLTNEGRVVPRQMYMNRQKIASIGIALLDNQVGPFCLEIEWIKAFNTDFTDADVDQVPYKYLKDPSTLSSV